MPYGSGHINDTYRAEFRHAGVSAHYILQRINSNIFKNPAAVMENIQRVTDHLAAQVAGEPDSRRRVLSLIPTRERALLACGCGGRPLARLSFH